MCRSTTQNGHSPFFATDPGRNRLSIRSFHLLLSLADGRRTSLPEILTLVYLPRIGVRPMEINGTEIRDDAPAFVALQLIRSREAEGGSEAAFANTDWIRAGDGLCFDVYVEGDKVLQGIFRRLAEWVVECRCAGEANLGAIGADVAELCVVMDGGDAIRVRVPMKVARSRFCSDLQGIPEEGEVEVSECRDEEEEEGRWGMVESDSWRWMEKKRIDGWDGLEMEGISWAVDLGILAVCLGVGLFLSRASLKRFLRL